jgi:hypothetical protein
METPSSLAMGESALPTIVARGMAGNEESMQEKDDDAKAEHHSNTGYLIATTSNEPSREPGSGVWDGAEAA